MPCCDPYPYYDQPTTSYATSNSRQVSSLKKELADLGKKYNELKARADKLTQLLCYACGTLVSIHGEQDLDGRLTDWWHEHNEWDFNRTLETMKKKFKTTAVDKKTAKIWFIDQAISVHPLSNYHCSDYFDEIWKQFDSWQRARLNRAKRIAELEAELLKLKTEA